MDFEYALTLVLQILCFIPAIVLHEVAHGYVAYRLGDPTAKAAGRLSLNPVRHIDPFGTVIMPLLLLAVGGPVFGYAKPVPYNPRYFKDTRKGDMLVGMAGPAANVVMALLGVCGLRLVVNLAGYVPSSAGTGIVTWALAYFFVQFVMLNLYLAFFNLIPLPPLDGSSLLLFFLPRKYLPQYYKVQQYAMPIFLAVVFLLPSFLHVDPIGAYLQATAGNIGAALVGLALS